MGWEESNQNNITPLIRMPNKAEMKENNNNTGRSTGV